VIDELPKHRSCAAGSFGPSDAGDAGQQCLEFAGLGCYITVMMTGRGWMLRIMGPILG